MLKCLSLLTRPAILAARHHKALYASVPGAVRAFSSESPDELTPPPEFFESGGWYSPASLERRISMQRKKTPGLRGRTTPPKSEEDHWAQAGVYGEDKKPEGVDKKPEEPVAVPVETTQHSTKR